MFLFLLRHAAVLLVVCAAIASAGKLMTGLRAPLALRAAVGLAVWGEALFVLAAAGWLRPAPVLVLFVLTIGGGVWRCLERQRMRAGCVVMAAIVAVPMFLLALHPPMAFDETLYHLPFVESLARSGQLQFLPQLRFPAFPQLHEILCVPLFWMGGDTATHLLSLVEILLTAALVAEWVRRSAGRAAPLAAALFLGSPIVLHLGTILYVDAALALFVAAGFYCLDDAIAHSENERTSLLLAGLFLGAACSVKYLGGFFAVAALVIVLIVRRRSAMIFAGACFAAALPTTLWLALTTGNPLFPYATAIFGSNDWLIDPLSSTPPSVVDTLRVLWDVTFARARMNGQPPMTLVLVLVPLVAAAALRDRRARVVTLLGGVYLALFAFLPRDSRYLVSLLPLVCVGAAVVVARRWPRVITIATLCTIAPAIAYLGWRLRVMGLPPVTAEARRAQLAARIGGFEALQRAGKTRVYVCGGEQLQAFAQGELLGDFFGPDAYQRVLTYDPALLASRLQARHVDYLLIIKRVCTTQPSNSNFTLAYEDERSQLWRVQGAASR